VKSRQIEKVALNMIKQNGLINLTKKDLCKACGIPDGSFKNIMGVTFSEFVDVLLKENKPWLNHHKVTKTKTNPELRKDQIINVAVEIARKTGCYNLTRQDIANKANVSLALINLYFGTMNQLKIAVMRRAVKQGIIEIIAEGLGNNDPQACKATKELKEKALSLISNR